MISLNLEFPSFYMTNKLRGIQNNGHYRIRLISQNECKSLDEEYFENFFLKEMTKMNCPILNCLI
jgi:hypothetical protein